MSGIYVVSVRRDIHPTAARAAAYAHIGLSTEMVRAETVALAHSFTDAGFGTSDIIALIDGLHRLTVDSNSLDVDVFEPFFERGGVDSEGRATSTFIFGLGDTDGSFDWLACVEAAHATWPRLLDVLGVSVGATFVNSAGGRMVRVPEARVPKRLRLKSGWDYDAEGNQIWLPIEEAWRRLVADNNARITPSDDKQMARIRSHMVEFYAGRVTTREARRSAG